MSGVIWGIGGRKIRGTWQNRRYHVTMVSGRSTPDYSNIPAEWLAEFEAAARRPLEQRMRYAFIKTYKPVLDDARFRAFETMDDYRRWCQRELPEWLGY